MRIFLLLTSLFYSLSTLAQVSNNPEAKILLDKVSSTTDSYEAIEIMFDYSIYNKAEDIEETANGVVLIKDQQYTLTFMGFTQISDGENVWTILNDDEEVQISEIDTEDETAITPSNLLKMYEKGFTYQLGAKNSNLQIVELTPTETEEVDFFKINLTIDTKVYQIKSIAQFGKNGTNSNYQIKSLTTQDIKDSTFVFDEQDFPDYDIIDMR
jgi:outer membrane lipoprotein-sorting protein